MVGAIALELGIQKEYLGGEKVETIYFGGGTPSLLAAIEIRNLLDQIHELFPVVDNPEITLEANPDDLNEPTLVALREAGVNRLSIGIQSFNNDILKFLNRAHDAAAAQRCLSASRLAGFSNISLDLIYAIPGLSNSQLEHSINRIIDFHPEHISCYALTIEERTVFGNWKKSGRLLPATDAVAAGQFETVVDQITSAGYEHYEISNFSLPGKYALHNSAYWEERKYLGVGPSAHSYDGDTRQFNARNNAIYVRSILNGEVPYEREVLTHENKVNEYIMTSLRTMWGCDLDRLKELGDDLQVRAGAYLETLMAHKLVTIDGMVMRLTRKGKMVADKIAGDLMLEA